MKIEFGCGTKLRNKGFIGCGVRKSPVVKYVCNCWDITQFVTENSVSEIYSRHMFEHLTFNQGRKALSSWYKILEPMGKVHLILPNLEYHVSQYMKYKDNRQQLSHIFGKKGITEFEHSICSIFGWQRDDDGGEAMVSDLMWNIHKSGYDFYMLTEVVLKTGFIKVERQHILPDYHLDIIFYKPK